MTSSATELLDLDNWRRMLLAPSAARFAGLFGDSEPGQGVRLTAVLFPADQDSPQLLTMRLAPGQLTYPALSGELPAAFWYERALHDLFGVTPIGHPRLDPLLLPLTDPDRAPRPGLSAAAVPLEPDERAIPRAAAGHGLFTIPHGPVRSGVVESVEYLVETPGEDIPRIQIRVFHKHRGVSKRFEHTSPGEAVLVAEHVEGVATIAHALALCHAVEALAGVEAPWPAQLVRVLHAELERIANHLDVMVRLSDAAGLAVACARFALHKEHVLRLVGHLCGSRFARGVVVPGGVTALPQLGPTELRARIDEIGVALSSDWRAAMNTPSFLDRLRGTGPLDPGLARAHGALGPVGKASGQASDARVDRPYDAYPALGLGRIAQQETGDALARTQVRGMEMRQSWRLVRQVIEELRATDLDQPLTTPLPADLDGVSCGWVEAPQGEVLYLVRCHQGRIARCAPRSASFHNLVLLHEVFAGDILTDFPFIEASFGLSIAGVSL